MTKGAAICPSSFRNITMMLRRILPWCGFAIAAALAAPVVAAGPVSIDSGLNALERAVPVTPPATDVVTVYDSGALDQATEVAALAAARDAGGTAVIGRSASLGMPRLTRDGSAVQQAPPGYAFPMGTTVLPNLAVGRVMGRDVAAVLAADTIVMGELTAGLRGAQAGDVVELIGASGAVVPFTIGAVVADEITGGTELLMSPDAADRLGINRPSRVLIWGFDSRAAIDDALVARGLISTRIRVRRSWDPFDPDFTLGMAQTKAELGEFAYRVNANGSLSIDADWRSEHITYGAIGQSPYRLSLPTGCHDRVRISLQAAMDELIATGNAGSINYYHANTAGGCYNPRFNRSATNSALGSISRHTWGMAVDTNTLGSCQGCAPPDFVTNGDCDTIRIFRKHGFAWGGNFLTPDGMHFEWVGEPRDQLPYPSRYCPNSPDGGSSGRPAGDQLPVAETARPTLFAHDGLDSDDDHQD